MAGENILVVEDNATILRVVESALTRVGYQVTTAVDAEGSLAAARESLGQRRRPALIVIDSLLGSTGSEVPATVDVSVQLCQALAGDVHLGKIPVVLLIPKGEDTEARFASTPNIVDYITKPFVPDALLTVVRHVIDKSVPKKKPGASINLAEALSRSSAPKKPVSDLARLRKAIAEQLERHRQESGSWEMDNIVAGALADTALSRMLADCGFAAGPNDGDSTADLSGQLGAISVNEVLSLLAQQSQTGTALIATGEARVELFFRKGRIQLAAAVGVAEEFLLGRFAVEAGDLTAETLELVLRERAQSKGKPPLFGRDLVARGLVSREQLVRAMRRQTAELVYEALRWSKGRFQFRHQEALSELAEEASLDISVDTLLLEGFRRVDEWRLIERDIHNFDLTFVRNETRIADLPRGTLTRDEIAVLDALSGKSSVRDIIRGLRMGSFDVTKILYRLLRTQLIRQRIDAIATS